MKKIISLLLVILFSFTIISCADLNLEFDDEIKSIDIENTQLQLSEKESYSNRDDVALYIYTYNKLPNNFITKKEAIKLGWNSREGNLWDVADGKSIGGDKFGNREGKLPDEDGRVYYECDINYKGGYRGAERLVYSNDGLIYYTDDHYKTFIILYGDDQE